MYKRSLHDNRDIPKKKKIQQSFSLKIIFAIPAGKAVSFSYYGLVRLCASAHTRTQTHMHIPLMFN